jgi:hypothetical protein
MLALLEIIFLPEYIARVNDTTFGNNEEIPPPVLLRFRTNVLS